MINWEKYSHQPTEENIFEYPTILDILKEFVSSEEKRDRTKLPLGPKDFAYNWTEPGYFLLIRDRLINSIALAPTSRTPKTFFRGQSCYYEKCLPSLFRCTDKDQEREELKAHLQTMEMGLIMFYHPVVKFINETPIDFNGLGKITFGPNLEGIAQHYGIKTRLLDFTNDIWAAAFFASTSYDGTYMPIIISDESVFSQRYGVLYRIDCDYHDGRDCNNDNIYPIGLQYFNRPGKQSGYARLMDDHKNLHEVENLKKIFFRHDNKASNLIFMLSQFGNRYIPRDSLAGVVTEICKHDRFCKASVDCARKAYYSTMDEEEFRNKVIESGFEITETLNATFDNQLVIEECNEWNNGERERFINNVLYLPMSRLK